MNQTAHPEGGMTRGRLLVVLAVVCVLILGLVFFMQYKDRNAKSPRAAGDKFAAALVDKNAADSYALLSDTLKEVTVEEDWKAWVDLSFEGDSNSYRFEEEIPISEPEKTYPEGSQPTRYIYQFTVSEKTFKYSLVLTLKDGIWKIAEIGDAQ